jgi:hypothetical protein
MAHRRIKDRYGHEWDVWEVIPAVIDRRIHEARPVQIERRTVASRGVAAAVSSELQGGWLAFQSPNEKRRLTPFPQHWASLSNAQILALLERATKVGKPARLVE